MSKYHIVGITYRGSHVCYCVCDLFQEFYETVIKNADIIQATGDAVCVFPEVQCLTPR